MQKYIALVVTQWDGSFYNSILEKLSIAQGKIEIHFNVLSLCFLINVDYQSIVCHWLITIYYVYMWNVPWETTSSLFTETSPFFLKGQVNEAKNVFLLYASPHLSWHDISTFLKDTKVYCIYSKSFGTHQPIKYKFAIPIREKSFVFIGQNFSRYWSPSSYAPDKNRFMLS